MYASHNRKYLSARILHYAANKIWILTTMASFISKSPGDNHSSCFPNTVPVPSAVKGWKRVEPGTIKLRAICFSILGDGLTSAGVYMNNRAAEKGPPDYHSTAGNNAGARGSNTNWDKGENK